MENVIYIKDLEELEDISNTLVITEEPSIFQDKEEEFLETCFELMDEYLEQNPHAISEPDFLETFQDEIEELFYAQWEEEMVWNEQVEEDLNELLEIAFDIYFSIFCQQRSFSFSISDSNANTNANSCTKKICLQDKIDYLKSKPQPVQRTDDWYKFRYNLITASNAYKAFESQAMMNQLIYEKCLPLKTFGSAESINTMVNTNTTLHWGQKYEPLSVLYYEEMYKTKIADFGCIQHDKYSFLGASPDGINVDQESERFGRMLEIKNIVNREITGIPKKEYWIQMQLQMEVCDLDECDFLETKFTEYPDMTSFYQDSQNLELMSNVNLKQGVILHFHTTSGAPHYAYKPLNIVDPEKIEEWEELMVSKYESEKHNMLFIKNIYWKLEKVSCVLVTRNKKWFQDNIGQIENIWRIIEKERISGYQHRAPNKRPKTEQNTKITNFFEKEEGCLINLNKIKVTKLPGENDENE